MFEGLHDNRKKQLVIGFFIGTAFGFLLDRGGATDFNIITNQLLLKDFTVLKIIFTAIIIGMIGVHIIVRYSSPELQPKPCIWKSIIIGSLIFGVGFAVLGLCPGTASGAMGTGAIHAVFGVIGMLVGAGIFASVYPRLMKFMERDDMGPVTIPEISGIKARWIVLIISIILIVIMYLLDMVGY